MWTQTAGKTASSGESIPEYQINEDEQLLETLNEVLKAFSVYRRRHITEEGNLTGWETVLKLKYEAFFLMLLISSKKTSLVDFLFIIW